MEHLLSLFVRSIFVDNMIFAFFLGMCSYLAVSKNVKTSLGLGVAVTFVLLVTVPVDYLLQTKVLSEDGILGQDLTYLAFILFIAVIAGIVQLVEMVVERFSPSLYAALGIFLPLIVVNCLILARAESFASSNKVGYAALDGLFMGIGFTFSLMIMALIREFIGTGCIFGVEIMSFSISIFATSAGGFLVFGLLIAAFVAANNAISNKMKHKQHEKQMLVEKEREQAIAAADAEVK